MFNLAKFVPTVDVMTCVKRVLAKEGKWLLKEIESGTYSEEMIAKLIVFSREDLKDTIGRLFYPSEELASKAMKLAKNFGRKEVKKACGKDAAMRILNLADKLSENAR